MGEELFTFNSLLAMPLAVFLVIVVTQGIRAVTRKAMKTNLLPLVVSALVAFLIAYMSGGEVPRDEPRILSITQEESIVAALNIFAIFFTYIGLEKWMMEQGSKATPEADEE